MKRTFSYTPSQRSLSSSPWWASDELDALQTHDLFDADDFGSHKYFSLSIDDENSSENPEIDNDQWMRENPDNGFVRLYRSEKRQSMLLRCSVSTTVDQMARQAGGGSMHVQVNGFRTRKLRGNECPLTLQNEHLRLLGYDDEARIQDEGKRLEIVRFVRFIIGK